MISRQSISGAEASSETDDKIPTTINPGAKLMLEGSVLLQIVIEGWNCRDLCALKASRRVFVDPAMEAVRQWRYEPAELEGRPIDVLSRVLVDFSLF